MRILEFFPPSLLGSRPDLRGEFIATWVDHLKRADGALAAVVAPGEVLERLNGGIAHDAARIEATRNDLGGILRRALPEGTPDQEVWVVRDARLPRLSQATLQALDEEARARSELVIALRKVPYGRHPAALAYRPMELVAVLGLSATPAVAGGSELSLTLGGLGAKLEAGRGYALRVIAKADNGRPLAESLPWEWTHFEDWAAGPLELRTLGAAGESVSVHGHPAFPAIRGPRARRSTVDDRRTQPAPGGLGGPAPQGRERMRQSEAELGALAPIPVAAEWSPAGLTVRWPSVEGANCTWVLVLSEYAGRGPCYLLPLVFSALCRFESDRHVMVRRDTGRPIHGRQDVPEIFERAGAVCAGRPSALRLLERLADAGRVSGFVVPSDEALSVETELDYARWRAVEEALEQRLAGGGG